MPPSNRISFHARQVIVAWHSFLRFPLLLCISLMSAACSMSHEPDVFVPDPNRDYSFGMLHCVVPNDSLADISRYYRRNIELLADLNHLKPPYEIYQGELLFIPPDNSYAVLKGGKVNREYIDKLRSQHTDMADALSPAIPTDSASTKKPSFIKSLFGGRTAAVAKTSSSSSNTLQKVSSTASLDTNKGRSIPFTNSLPTDKKGAYVWPVGGRFERGFNPDPENPHKGIDIASPAGTVIRASRAGKVLYAGRFGSYGLVVVIDHGNGFSTLYGHTSKTLVAQGQAVSQLQPIAEVGSTGRSTGPHLHFEVRYNAEAVNPEKYLPPIR
jgi:murein DD-endopeptidase MepM/ murein hydrolase activator NlpD